MCPGLGSAVMEDIGVIHVCVAPAHEGQDHTVLVCKSLLLLVHSD